MAQIICADLLQPPGKSEVFSNKSGLKPTQIGDIGGSADPDLLLGFLMLVQSEGGESVIRSDRISDTEQSVISHTVSVTLAFQFGVFRPSLGSVVFRSAAISRLINWSIDKKIIGNHFDNLF